APPVVFLVTFPAAHWRAQDRAAIGRLRPLLSSNRAATTGLPAPEFHPGAPAFRTRVSLREPYQLIGNAFCTPACTERCPVQEKEPKGNRNCREQGRHANERSAEH